MAKDIEVIYVRGKVLVESETGEISKLVIGSIVTENSKISVAEEALAILKIENHSTHKLEADTEIIIHELPYFYEDSNELEQGSIIELMKGIIFSEVHKKSGTETLKIVSAKTTLGVRGTRFLVSKDEENNLLAVVNEGQVEVSGPEQKQIDFLEKDDSIEILQGKKFQKRQKFNFVKGIDWNVSEKDQKSSFKNLKKIAKEELTKRRQPWTKDPARIEKFKSAWLERKSMWQARIKNLKPSQKLKLRKGLKVKRSHLIREEKLENKFLNKNKKSTLKERFQNRREDIKSRVQDKKSKIKQSVESRRK